MKPIESEFRPTKEQLDEMLEQAERRLRAATDDELATALEYAKETLSTENIRAEVEKTREMLESNPMPFGRPIKNRSISSNVHYAELHDGTLDKKAIKKVSDSLGGKKKSWLRRLFSWK